MNNLTWFVKSCKTIQRQSVKGNGMECIMRPYIQIKRDMQILLEGVQCVITYKSLLDLYVIQTRSHTFKVLHTLLIN